MTAQNALWKKTRLRALSFSADGTQGKGVSITVALTHEL